MSDSVRVALSGLGGYGEYYLRYFLDKADTRVLFIGGVDPAPDRCGRLDKLHERRIPIYRSLTELYASEEVDLLCIAAPHHYHADQTCQALESGSHVLCEKPLSPTVEEARRMAACCKSVGGAVTIGYQWSHARAIQALKADILSGALGKPRRLKTLVRWPRGHVYYGRNGWAGRISTDSGRKVLDSPLMNATAHFLHNMLYVIGPAVDRAAAPLTVVGELYRANHIENYDTAAVRCLAEGDVEVLFVTTHAAENRAGMLFEYEFDKAIVSYTDKRVVAQMRDGSRRDYGSPDENQYAKIEHMLNVLMREATIVCGIEAALSHVLVADAVQHSSIVIPFPPHMIQDDGTRCWVEGLSDALEGCYKSGQLPSERGFSWASPGRLIYVDTFKG
jgi:predicted dehydrogenase